MMGWKIVSKRRKVSKESAGVDRHGDRKRFRCACEFAKGRQVLSSSNSPSMVNVNPSSEFEWDDSSSLSTFERRMLKKAVYNLLYNVERPSVLSERFALREEALSKFYNQWHERHWNSESPIEDWVDVNVSGIVIEDRLIREKRCVRMK